MSTEKVQMAVTDAGMKAGTAYREAAVVASAEKARLNQLAWNAEEEAAQLTAAAKVKSAEACELRKQAAKFEVKGSETTTQADLQPGVIDRMRTGLEHAREAVAEAFVTAKQSIAQTAQGAQQSIAETSASAKEKIAHGLESLSATAAESGADFKKSAAESHQEAAAHGAARHNLEIKASAGATPDAPHMAPCNQAKCTQATCTQSTAAAPTAAPTGAGLKESVASTVEAAAHWTAISAKQLEASAGEQRTDAQLAQGKLPQKL